MSGRIIKAFKWFGLTLGAVLVITTILYLDLIIYGIRQAKGQLHIVWNARPVEQYMADPAFPDSLKSKLNLIEEVRKFAIDSLGLKESKNYKTLYDQKGKEIMWVVTASEPFRLKEKEWIFPILGAVPYKGFFNKDLAIQEKQRLEKEGWDVSVRNPGGWSTLGWFTDPILSEMLSRSEGDLASLIIHEMVHATIFVKDSVELNENLASFIGDRGAEMFLVSRFGKQSKEYQRYTQEEKDFTRYVDHVLRGCDHLDSLYTAIEAKAEEEKIRYKEASIRKIISTSDTLSLSVLTIPSQKYLDTLPNNAYFMSFIRYQSRQDYFWYEWQHMFHRDLRAYINHLTQRHPFL